MAGQIQEVQEQIEIEKHAHEVILAALNDAAFMQDVFESFRLEAAGEAGEPWSEVKTRLGLV